MSWMNNYGLSDRQAQAILDNAVSSVDWPRTGKR